MRIQLLSGFTALLLTLALHARTHGSADPDMAEMRIEIDDLKHALHTMQVDFNLLDERFKKQDSLKNQSASRESKDVNSLSLQISSLEKKIAHLEKTWEKAATDLRNLSLNVNQALSKIGALETELAQCDKRLDEVSKLKGTLTSISKAIGQQPTSAPTTTKSYIVKAGDTLEKIARKNGISVEALQKCNNLRDDKIRVGQELRLTDDTR